jgi:hypothetical protein
MNRRLEDKDIDAYLKRNQPVAPAIDEAKMQASLLAKLGLTLPPARRRPSSWMAFSGALAAGLVLMFFVARPSLQQNPSLATPIQALEVDWDDEIYEDDMPAMDVGEDYLELVASK